MISVCLLAKNQEQDIEAGIKHFMSFAKEVVVTDLGSTDETPKVAERAGAKVHSFEFANDYSAARNRGIEQAIQPWILTMEVNERIISDDHLRLRALIASTEAQAIRVNIRTYTNDSSRGGFVPLTAHEIANHGTKGYTKSRRIKIFQNKPGIRFNGSVYESVDHSVQASILDSTLTIHSYHSQSHKPAEMTAGLCQKIDANPNDWIALFHLGLAYLNEGQSDLAIGTLKKSLEIRSTPLTFSHLGAALMTANKRDEADHFFRLGLREYPTDHDLLHNYAVLQMEQKNWTEAADIFQRVLEHHPHSFSAYRGFGFVLLNLNQVDQAKLQLKRSLEIFPDYEDGKIDLGIAHLAQGDRQEAQALAQSVLDSNPSSLRGQGLMKAVSGTLEIPVS